MEFAIARMAWFTRALKNLRIKLFSWFHKLETNQIIVPLVQKLKEASTALKSAVKAAVACFSKVFTPATADNIHIALVQKPKEAFSALINAVKVALAKIAATARPYLVRKSKEGLSAVINAVKVALAKIGDIAHPYLIVIMEALKAVINAVKVWLDKIVPRAEEVIIECVVIGRPYIIPVVVVAVALYFYFCGGVAVEMMKAPGRGFMMPRGIFESDPAAYFRDLHA